MMGNFAWYRISGLFFLHFDECCGAAFWPPRFPLWETNSQTPWLHLRETHSHLSPCKLLFFFHWHQDIFYLTLFFRSWNCNAFDVERFGVYTVWHFHSFQDLRFLCLSPNWNIFRDCIIPCSLPFSSFPAGTQKLWAILECHLDLPSLSESVSL